MPPTPTSDQDAPMVTPQVDDETKAAIWHAIALAIVAQLVEINAAYEAKQRAKEQTAG